MKNRLFENMLEIGINLVMAIIVISTALKAAF